MISTGLLNLKTLDKIKKFWSLHGDTNLLSFLHCVSSYPTPDNEANLGSIVKLKKYYPKIDIINNDEDKQTFGNFSDLMLDHYESDNQITFFVPNDEEQYTLDELTDVLI